MAIAMTIVWHSNLRIKRIYVAIHQFLELMLRTKKVSTIHNTQYIERWNQNNYQLCSTISTMCHKLYKTRGYTPVNSLRVWLSAADVGNETFFVFRVGTFFMSILERWRMTVSAVSQYSQKYHCQMSNNMQKRWNIVVHICIYDSEHTYSKSLQIA